MKKSEKKTPGPQQGTEEINWVVLGPILAVMLGSIVWAVIF